jgi:fumarate reductase subunit D
MRSNDRRAWHHPSGWAQLAHRLSGLALALFLPLHFWALSQALHGAAGLDAFLRWTDHPLVKLAEWGLVLLLALHMALGLRVLVIEFRPWSGLRKNAVTLAAGFGLAASLAFALALLS